MSITFKNNDIEVIRVEEKFLAKTFADMIPENKNFPYSKELLQKYCQKHLPDDDHVFFQAWEENRKKMTGVLIAQMREIPNECGVLLLSAKTKQARDQLAKSILLLSYCLGKEFIAYNTHRNYKAMNRIFGGRGKVLCVTVGGLVKEAMEDYGILETYSGV